MAADDPPRKKMRCEVSAEKRSMDPFRVTILQVLSKNFTEVDISKLMKKGSMKDYLRPWLKMWYTNVSIGEPGATSTAILEVFEENFVELLRLKNEDKNIYCRHCSYAGWGMHPVCSKRYHFIIRNNPKNLDAPGLKGISEPHSLVSEDHDHLLHGLVHSNGFGHLVRLNGKQGGSQILTGSNLMGFWDNLCMNLRVRKITVMDISKKYDMEYRLLHAVSHGHPWYGKWGYEFGRGSFGLTFEAYKEALEFLSTEPLSHFSNSRSPQCKLQDTIAFYQFLSDIPLITVRDIFSFIRILLERHTHERKAESIVQKQVSRELCIWSAKEEKSSFNTILKVLKATGPRQWVSWRTLKGAISQSVESLELLRYCLGNLAGKTTEDGEVVVIRCNKETNTIEFGLRLQAAVHDSHGSEVAQMFKPSKEQILSDLKYLYNMLLYPQTMHGYNPNSKLHSAHLSATKVLNCKHLMKHYDKEDDLAVSDPRSIQITSNIKVVGNYEDTVCPPEILALPITATVGDLKAKAAKAVRESYLIYQDFEAEELLDCKVASETTQVKLLFGSRGNVSINGRCHGSRRKLGIYRMEQGVEKWMVDCVCGAQDDDGERMLACDLCGVWQHTRCSDIKDAEDVPRRFVCRMCKGSPKDNFVFTSE